MKHYKIKGFTLLEVLVALAILAIALTALLKAGSQHIENVGYLRDKTLAHWVALRVLTEIQIGQRLLEGNQQEGTMMMADREWFWVVTVLETPEKQLHRLEVKVYAKHSGTFSSEALILLVGFIT
jgi:general secretion pathway protein I